MQTFLNLSRIHRQQKVYPKLFESLVEAFLSVTSQEAFNKVFSLFAQVVKALVEASAWEALVALKAPAEKLPAKDLANFCLAVSEFAEFQKTADKKSQRYMQAREKLAPEFKEALDDLLVIEAGEEKAKEEREKEQ